MTHTFPLELRGKRTAISACGTPFRLSDLPTFEAVHPSCRACEAFLAEGDRDDDPFSGDPQPDPVPDDGTEQLSMFDHYQQRG